MALKAALSAEELSGLNSGRSTDILRRFGETIDLGTRLNDLSSLALTTTGNGASLIGIEDAAGVFTGTTVEAALQELAGAGGIIVDLIFKAATELTIATGAITATQAVHTVDTQADAASDDLDTMAGGTVEEIVFLRPASAARTVVVKHAIGANCFACPGARDISLAEGTDWVMCAYDGTQWVVVAWNTLALGGGGLGSALASTANGLGASLVGIEDSATTITATNVETALAELSNRVRTQLVTCTLTAGGDLGNTQVVTINVVDLNGTAVSRAQRLLCELYTADMLHALAAAWTMAETGAGSEVSTTAKPSLLIDTDANGDASLTITDVATGSAATLYLKVTPVPTSGTYLHGTPAIIPVTFAT